MNEASSMEHGVGLITQLMSARYALQSVVYLAQNDPRRFVAVEEMARKRKLPASFLAKVLRRLAAKGLLNVRRGPSGGYALAKDPRAIRASDVFDALTDSGNGRGCLLGIKPCNGSNPCEIHDTVVQAEQRLREGLEQITIAALANEGV